MTSRRSPFALLLRTLVPAALLAAAASGASAQEPPGDYVSVKVYADRDVYQPGDTARVAVELRIDPRVHVNSDSPKDEFAIPTALSWDEPPAGVALSAVRWPKAEWKAFEFTDGEKIPVFEGKVRAYLTATVPKDAERGGTVKVTGTLKAQGCTHSACYAPQKDSVTLKLRVAEEGEESLPVNESKFEGGAAAQ